MNKQLIRLTESDLHCIIEDSVKQYLIQEGFFGDMWNGAKNMASTAWNTAGAAYYNGIANGQIRKLYQLRAEHQQAVEQLEAKIEQLQQKAQDKQKMAQGGIQPNTNFKQQQMAQGGIQPSANFKQQQMAQGGIQPNTNFNQQMAQGGIQPNANFKQQQMAQGGIQPSANFNQQMNLGYNNSVVQPNLRQQQPLTTNPTSNSTNNMVQPNSSQGLQATDSTTDKSNLSQQKPINQRKKKRKIR